MLFKKYSPLILLATIVVFIGCGSASPVINYQNSPVETRTGSKNVADIRQAIIVAGSTTGWQMQETQQGRITATQFKGGHMAKIDITYTAQTFNINYKDSSNFQYTGTNISNTYNKWVKNLYKHIAKNLSKL